MDNPEKLATFGHLVIISCQPLLNQILQ